MVENEAPGVLSIGLRVRVLSELWVKAGKGMTLGRAKITTTSVEQVFDPERGIRSGEGIGE
jgi:hypothetical protein